MSPNSKILPKARILPNSWSPLLRVCGFKHKSFAASPSPREAGNGSATVPLETRATVSSAPTFEGNLSDSSFDLLQVYKTMQNRMNSAISWEKLLLWRFLSRLLLSIAYSWSSSNFTVSISWYSLKLNEDFAVLSFLMIFLLRFCSTSNRGGSEDNEGDERSG